MRTGRWAISAKPMSCLRIAVCLGDSGKWSRRKPGLPRRSRLWAGLTGFDNELELFAECGRKLAGILTGKVDPLEILFPGGSAKRVEGVYRDSPYAKVTNGLVQTALANVVRQLPAARGLRVLEIGGGTGRDGVLR